MRFCPTYFLTGQWRQHWMFSLVDLRQWIITPTILAKGFGTPPLFHVFLYGTCSLTRFLPHPPPLPPRTKLRALTFARYVKGVWLVTPNTFRRGGGSTRITFSSPETQSVPNVWTRIVRPTKLSSYLKESAIFTWKRGSPRHSSRSEVYNLFPRLHHTRIRYSLGYKLLEFRWCRE